MVSYQLMYIGLYFVCMRTYLTHMRTLVRTLARTLVRTLARTLRVPYAYLRRTLNSHNLGHAYSIRALGVP